MSKSKTTEPVGTPSNGKLDPNRVISPMLQILNRLVKVGPRTRRELAAEIGVDISTIGIAIGENSPESRTKGDARRRYSSLLTRQHIKICREDRDGEPIDALAITAKGKKFLETHTDGTGKAPKLSDKAGVPRGPNQPK